MNEIRLLLFCIICVLIEGKLVPKQLAGPPQEFAEHYLPTPLAGALTEDSAFLEFILQANGQKGQWESDLPVDSKQYFSIAFFSPFENQLTLILNDPQGKNVKLKPQKTHFPIGLEQVSGTIYFFEKPEVGIYHLTIKTKDGLSNEEVQAILNSQNEADGIVILWNYSTMRMYTHLNTYNLHTGQQIGLITTMTEDSNFTDFRAAKPSLNNAILKAEMFVFSPSGSETDVEMHDDGLHMDGAASDGVYGGLIQATQVGTYRVEALLKGTTSDGVEFLRTTQHLISVVEDNIKLTGTAIGQMKDSERMTISLGVASQGDMDHLNPIYRAYAEVWGKDAKGTNIPICWIQSMVDVNKIEQSSISLELNMKWVKLANAQEPFTLKNVYLTDSYTNVPVEEMDQIVVKTSGSLFDVIDKLEVPEITKEMRQGVLPQRKVVNSTQATSGLILLHGYCHGNNNPWSASSQDFSNAYYFSASSGNLANQDFAAQVAEYADSLGLTSFGLLGHSQGGSVSLHLLNYFFSGMDYASSGRLVQSVGTPYMGCTAAGSAANLGKAFGVGCGENFDLSLDGAKLWHSGLSADAKSEVHFYTTTYNQGNFFGDYCNMAMNFVLEWPNDGTSELEYAVLSGGVNMGNKQGWCHTTDMKYPAQYTDHVRNRDMNQAAAR